MISSPNNKKRVLSGARPTGKLHLGNYVGAVSNWVRMQDEYECFFFIADWHALTTDYADTSKIKENSFDVLLDLLAAGIDPERCTLFLQSHVPQHAELYLLFSMITPLGWLERVPTYKDQQENLKGKDLSTHGFLGYPVLQAADILMYKGDFVPVGEDQVPHVELTREIARRFNFFFPRRSNIPAKKLSREEESKAIFDPQTELAHESLIHPHGSTFAKPAQGEQEDGQEIFPEPQPLLTPTPKLPGTDGRKMSKSYGNTILLADPEPVIRQKLKTMVTDPARIRRSDPGNPDVCPVGDLHKLFSSRETLDKVYAGCRSAGIGCIECKGWAADALVTMLNPMQERRRKFEENPRLAWDILEAGSAKARIVASATMSEVRQAMGMSLQYQAPADGPAAK